MRWLLAGLFLLVYTIALPQSFKLSRIHTLEQKINQLKPGHAKAAVELELFRYYLNNDSKRALALANTSLKESEQLKNDSDICVFLDLIGEAYIYLDDAKNAIKYLNQDQALAQKIGYKQQIALAFTDLSGVYQNESDYSTAQLYSFKAITIYEQLKDYRQIAVCDFNIGVTYYNNNDYKKAILYGQKALAITQKSINKDVVPNAYTLIGSAWSSLKNNAEAQKYFQLALNIYQRSKSDYGQAIVLSQLLGTYPGDYRKQIELGLQAQQLWDRIAPENFYSIYNLGYLGCAFGETAIHENAGTIRADLFKKAQSYLAKAITLAKKTNTKAAIIDLTDSLSVINAAIGDYKHAYFNLKTSSTLYDSVYSQDNKNKIASIEGVHEIALRDKQLQINNLELTGRSRQLYFLSGGLGLLIVIAILIYAQSLQRKKTNLALKQLNEQLDEANKTKTRFFNILNHDLRTPVASFLNFLHLQQKAPDLVSNNLRTEYSAKMVESAEHLLNTMEDLLLWTKGQMENFKPQITQVKADSLFTYVQQTFGHFSNIRFEFGNNDGVIIDTDEHYLKTIMHNLTSNAVKVLTNTPNATINWKAWQHDGTTYLSIIDNGPGATVENLKALYDDSVPVGIKNGLGLHIVRDMAKAINCKVAVDPKQKNGTGIQLVFNTSFAHFTEKRK